MSRIRMRRPETARTLEAMTNKELSCIAFFGDLVVGDNLPTTTFRATPAEQAAAWQLLRLKEAPNA
jgi:hypothetical protein